MTHRSRRALIIVTFVLSFAGAVSCSSDPPATNTIGNPTSTAAPSAINGAPTTAAPTTAGPASGATSTTARTGPTVGPSAENAPACKEIDAIDLSKPGFVEGFKSIYEHVTNAIAVAPASIKQPLVDLKAALDVVKPAIDAGTIKSNADFLAWVKLQPADTQTRLINATKTVQLFQTQFCDI